MTHVTRPYASVASVCVSSVLRTHANTRNPIKRACVSSFSLSKFELTQSSALNAKGGLGCPPVCVSSRVLDCRIEQNDDAARPQGVHPSIEKKVPSRAAQARHCSPMRTACTPPCRIPQAYQWPAHKHQLCARPAHIPWRHPLGQQANRATPGVMPVSRYAAAPSAPETQNQN